MENNNDTNDNNNTTTDKCSQPNVIKYCMFNTQRADYAKLKTGGNDPKISNAMRYSQLVQKNGRR